MKRFFLQGLAVCTLAGCMTVPPKAVDPQSEVSRAEAAIAEKLPLVTPLPVTADNYATQLQALQAEMDLQLKRLAAAPKKDSEVK